MKYQGWKFEKTALVEISDIHPRLNAFLNVTLRIPNHHAVNIENALRVVAKPAWNRYGKELPHQIHGLHQDGDETVFSVAFRGDLYPGEPNRFGFLYANETAHANDYQSDLTVSRSDGLGFSIDAPHYQFNANPRSGLPEYLMLKLHYLEGTFPKDVITKAQPQDGVRVMIDNGGSPLLLSEGTPLEGSISVFDSGPLFTHVRKHCLLGPKDGKASGPALPSLQTDYYFYTGQPLYSVHTRLHFPETTKVYRVAHDTITVADNMFSHYSFRPVSKCLPQRDLEEMGHVLIDPAYTDEIPDGPLMGSLIPGDLAWHAFIRIHKGSRVSRYAHTRINLSAPAAGDVGYQSSTIVEKDSKQKTVSACRYPIYVRNCDNPANALVVEKGTTFENSSLHYVQKWDEETFAEKTELIAKVMNNPPAISIHPEIPFAKQQKNVAALHPFYGNYHAAYTHPGVR